MLIGQIGALAIEALNPAAQRGADRSPPDAFPRARSGMPAQLLFRPAQCAGERKAPLRLDDGQVSGGITGL